MYWLSCVVHSCSCQCDGSVSTNVECGWVRLKSWFLFIPQQTPSSGLACMFNSRLASKSEFTSNPEPECSVTNWMSARINYWRAVWRERKTMVNNLQEGAVDTDGRARSDGRLWTDSALPWLWEQQLSSLLGIPVVQMAQSLLLTRNVMAFCPPSLYFLHFKVVNKGREGSECFHTQPWDLQDDGKAFFNAERKSLSKRDVLHRLALRLQPTGTTQCRAWVQCRRIFQWFTLIHLLLEGKQVELCYFRCLELTRCSNLSS